jgi:hypothetical protein
MVTDTNPKYDSKNLRSWECKYGSNIINVKEVQGKSGIYSIMINGIKLYDLQDNDLIMLEELVQPKATSTATTTTATTTTTTTTGTTVTTGSTSSDTPRLNLGLLTASQPNNQPSALISNIPIGSPNSVIQFEPDISTIALAIVNYDPSYIVNGKSDNEIKAKYNELVTSKCIVGAPVKIETSNKK